MHVRLRDGSEIEIRPIGPEDRQMLADGFERLSPESRYRRFFAPVARLRDRDLDYLTHVDHHDHEALVAADAGTGEGVGVARYVRTGSDVAEPAIVVVDDWQGRGVGGALIDALVDRAREEGVRHFEAPVLASNHEAIGLLERIGRTASQVNGREVMLTIDLPPAIEQPPNWSELLRQFASGVVQPARSLLALVWPRRVGAPDDVRSNVIVLGIDGSAHARAAAEAAAALAAPSGAALAVVGVHPFLASHQADIAAAVEQVADALRARGLRVDEHLRRGDPATALTDVAVEEQARLIVVGAGDRSKVARRVVGGVADLVAERSPCSVLIVRPDVAREG